MIADLEKKQEKEGQLLKDELDNTIKKITPSNILKSLLKDFYSSDSLLDELINTAVSVTSGYVTKKMVVGKSKNQVLRLIGMALQFGITTVIAKKFHQFKKNINHFIASFFGVKEETKVKTDETATNEESSFDKNQQNSEFDSKSSEE